MTLWDYPVLVILAVAGAFAVAALLLRVGNRTHPPDFECDVCGRKQRSLFARDWRFCPYCGSRARRPRPRY